MPKLNLLDDENVLDKILRGEKLVSPEIDYSKLVSPQNKFMMSGEGPGMDYTKIDAPENKAAIKEYLAGKFDTAKRAPAVASSDEMPYFKDDTALDLAKDKEATSTLLAGIGSGLDDLTRGATGFTPDQEFYKAMRTNASAPVTRETDRQKQIQNYLKDKYEGKLKEKSYDLQLKELQNRMRHEAAMEGLDRQKLAVEQQKAGTGSPDERKAAGYAKELSEADNLLGGIRGKGFNREDSFLASGPEWLKTAAGVTGLADSGMSANDQAERRFVNATLRRESGAAISNTERDEAARQYFPRPGDSPEAIKQKSANRRSKIDSMKSESGPLGRSLSSPARTEESKMVTIRNAKTGETKQVTEDEARKIGALK